MEQVTMIETNDGKLHETWEDAENHINDKLCEILDNRLKEIVHKKNRHHWQISQVIEIVEFLFCDYKSSKKLIKTLNNRIE